MQSRIVSLFCLLAIAVMVPIVAMAGSPLAVCEYRANNKDMPKLENPVTVEYLKEHLPDETPRLVLNPEIERNLKKALKEDPVVRNVYRTIKLNAKEILNMPLLERTFVGRRLLGTSREMLYRMNMLGMVYRMEKDSRILERINREVKAVCRFRDWNPAHYLDVAEMSMAVALAVDWAGEDLPASTVESAKTTLIEKGINPSYNEENSTGRKNTFKSLQNLKG